MLKWLPFGQKPRFESLKQEILMNPESTIDDHIFSHYLMVCIAKIKDTKYTVNEMMCLKLYSDTTDLQAMLRRAHWTVTPLEVRKVYYRWAMGLYRAHLYHAEPVPATSKGRPCRLFEVINTTGPANSRRNQV